MSSILHWSENPLILSKPANRVIRTQDLLNKLGVQESWCDDGLPLTHLYMQITFLKSPWALACVAKNNLHLWESSWCSFYSQAGVHMSSPLGALHGLPIPTVIVVINIFFIGWVHWQVVQPQYALAVHSVIVSVLAPYQLIRLVLTNVHWWFRDLQVSNVVLLEEWSVRLCRFV